MRPVCIAGLFCVRFSIASPTFVLAQTVEGAILRGQPERLRSDLI